MSIGILGLGHYATSWYFGEFNRRFNLNHGDFSTCPLILYNINFQRINPHLPSNFEHLTPEIRAIEKEIQPLNRGFWLIPNITFHEALEKAKCTLPFANPLDLAGKKMQKLGIKSATILGTRFSMDSPYFTKKLFKYGVKISPPNTSNFNWIDKYRTAIYEGENTAEQDNQYRTILSETVKKGTVIIACTELSTIPTDLENVFDLAQLHIEHALEKIR